MCKSTFPIVFALFRPFSFCPLKCRGTPRSQLVPKLKAKDLIFFLSLFFPLYPPGISYKKKTPGALKL